MTEVKRLIECIKKWKGSHFPNEEASWYIQNLLGDYLGWGTPEQEEVSKLFTPIQPEADYHQAYNQAKHDWEGNTPEAEKKSGTTYTDSGAEKPVQFEPITEYNERIFPKDLHLDPKPHQPQEIKKPNMMFDLETKEVTLYKDFCSWVSVVTDRLNGREK